jgi:hypothetical protein
MKRLLFASVACGASIFACIGDHPATPFSPSSLAEAGAGKDAQAEGGAPAAAAAGVIDTAFGTNGSVALDGIAAAMVTLPGGEILWTNPTQDGSQVAFHRLNASGAPVKQFPVPFGPDSSAEVPSAMAMVSTSDGTPILILGGIQTVPPSPGRPAPHLQMFGRAFAPADLVALPTPKLVADNGFKLTGQSITFDPASSTIAMLGGWTDSGNGGCKAFTDNNELFSVDDTASISCVASILDPNDHGSVIAAAMTTADNMLLLRRGKLAVNGGDVGWHSGSSLSVTLPAGGLDNAGLGAAGDGTVFAVGFIKVNKLFFQKVTKIGTLNGTLQVIAVSAMPEHFGALVQDGARTYIGGCTNTPHRAWVAAIDENGALDKTFGTGGELFLAPPAADGECVKALQVDHLHGLVALVGSEATPIGFDRIARVK